MKKSFSMIFAVLVLVAALSGCGGGGGVVQQVVYTSDNTGTVDGYVYAPVTGTARSASAPAGYIPLSGATVTVDSQSTTTDSTGYYKLEGVPVGSKSVSISKTGYEKITVQVTVEKNKTVEATNADSTAGAMMLSQSGSIKILSDPVGAAIQINQVDTGLTTPCTLTGIPPGTHTIEFTKTDYISETRTVTVSQGATATVSIAIDKHFHLCEEDSQCIKVVDGCCDCYSGGANMSINEDYSEEYIDSKTCEGGCLMVISTHWTCSDSAVPRCVDQRCKLVLEE